MWKECKLCSSYLVSTEGEVKHKKTNKILKPKIDKDGYLSVGLSMGKRGNRKIAFIHRLVAEAYVPNPYNKPNVKHIDDNKRNNEYTNLIWVTEQETVVYSNKPCNGSLSSNSKLTDMEILYCRVMYKPRDKHHSCAALAEQFGVSKSTMYYILKNITYKSPNIKKEV